MSFSPEDMAFDSKLVQAYQATGTKTKCFQLRLLELVAVAVHDIAVSLWENITEGQGQHDPKPPPGTIAGTNIPLPPRASDFMHGAYKDWQQYPEGKDELVGYWAELQIFSGVVVFDRGENDLECKDAFVHPAGSWMLFQLSDPQIASFAALGSATSAIEGSGAEFVLLFKAEKYSRRVPPEDAMALHIFRDRYERKPIDYSTRGWCVKRRAEDIVESFEALEELRRRHEGM